EEVAVDAALVAIVPADDLQSAFVAADAERGLAAIGAMHARRADVLHLPGARLVAISARGERADRADIDAHAALFAFQVVALVGRDDGGGAAVLHAERPHVHGLAADAHAAVAEDAARPVEEDHRRPLLLFFVELGFHEARFGGAVAEGHVLQFALAAGVADGAVERMVAEQKLERGLARLADFFAGGGDDHAVGDGDGAGRLHLRHLLDLDQAHAAGGLERETRVIAERRHLDAHALAGL